MQQIINVKDVSYMKILIISSLQEETPPKGYGGIERFIDYLATSLTNKNHAIHVICKKGSVQSNYTKLCIEPKKLMEGVKEEINAFRPDIVHINQRENELISFLNQTEIPTVITLHNNVRNNSSWIPIFETLNNNFFITTISENLKKRVIEAAKSQNKQMHVNKLTTLGYGIDTSLYKQFADINIEKEYFVYLGNVVRYKGVLDIVKSFSCTDQKLIVVGPENRYAEPEYIQQLHEYYNKFPNLKYFGETSNDLEKITLLSKAKGLVIATGYDPLEADCHEAFGLVMLEANALGVPVFGYAKGNVADYIIDGVNGYKFNNISELQDLIKKASIEDLFSKCLNIAEHYDINKISQKYENFFNKVLKRTHE